MTKLKDFSKELMEKNDQISEKLGQLEKEVDNFSYSKEHYDTIMKLCIEGLKIMEETKQKTSDIREFVDNYITPIDSITSQLKQILINHIDGEEPEALDGTEDVILDIMNMYKEKFSKKQQELKSFDQWRRAYMFYTKQADPSIMELEF